MGRVKWSESQLANLGRVKAEVFMSKNYFCKCYYEWGGDPWTVASLQDFSNDNWILYVASVKLRQFCAAQASEPEVDCH